MNEMKHFFTTSSVGTISECLNGEKLLNASRDAKGNTLLTFESAYEGYSDLPVSYTHLRFAACERL